MHPDPILDGLLAALTQLPPNASGRQCVYAPDEPLIVIIADRLEETDHPA